MNLGVFLKRIGWTDGDLAEQTGVSRVYVNAVRLGHKSPSPAFRRDAAVVLARALREDADQLRVRVFGPEPTKPQRSSVFRKEEA